MGAEVEGRWRIRWRRRGGLASDGSCCYVLFAGKTDGGAAFGVAGWADGRFSWLKGWGRDEEEEVEG